MGERVGRTEVDRADWEAVAAQLGRPPRGLRSVAHRCACGLPSVVQTSPRLEDGTPFPTLYYLTCARLAGLVGRLEASGTMREMTDRLAADPELAQAYRAAHESYLAERDAVQPLGTQVSAGGMPDRVKCLHVHVAHALARGPGVNPFGDEVLAQIGHWWTPGRCVPHPEVEMARVAAIDCGTNSIRLLVADLGAGQLRAVHREMRIVRLGQDVDATGRLAPDALERTRVALADYAAIVRDTGADKVRMVATSAVRDAANREDFFAMVRQTLGIDAEVISGDEEARLSFTGAVGGLDPADGPFVVVDVGGGSTEVVLGHWDGTRADVVAARSVNIGCVRITERHLHSDPATPDEVSAAEQFTTVTLQEAFNEVPVDRARTWVGVAGTITTLSAVAQRLPGYDPERIHLSRLSLEQVRGTAEHLLASTHQQRASDPAIHPGRVDVIAGGALIVRVLAGQLHSRAGIGELVVSEHDILDGIALGLG